ncbi:carbon-nitrogen hydrolase family protein [Nocardioides sp. TRM66260-LWL]|uniref:carbon-nitrogen hydrolase family protein n=1 Tax=Nocardioides sp. TRM66260-LWL TaxID=2874478 RepID=UPI001CC5C478|nr:carbon-nitrogen hydrolase family protein [Nocardioides sp. TRM66260-LWL]MBZ5733668.1 carbon-nitrogen hydrolase family protein [Nocardioides sp. TRM66260-LWL]
MSTHGTTPGTTPGSTPGALGLAAVADHFGRDVGENLALIGRHVAAARARGVRLLALPEACLGGYLSTLGSGRDGSHAEAPDSLPPAMDVDGPEIAALVRIAREMTLVVGLCESDGSRRFNSAVALSGDGVHGVHRKVHQPLGEHLFYDAGDGFAAHDTPVGRLGLLICYDKAFPEAARALALDGARTIACISAWPASRTATAESLADDRWTHRHNLFDAARALENQVVWVSANQTGTFGRLRFVGHAKVIGPGGDVLADTGIGSGLAVARLDLDETLSTARRAMFHLGDRRPAAYAALRETVDA